MESTATSARSGPNPLLFLAMIMFCWYAGLVWGDRTGMLLYQAPLPFVLAFALVAKHTLLKRLSDEDRRRWWKAYSMVALPLVLPLVQYIMAPGFLIPFTSQPTAKLIFIPFLLWSIIGSVIVYRVSSRISEALIWIFFGVPLFIVPVVLPALVLWVHIPGLGCLAPYG